MVMSPSQYAALAGARLLVTNQIDPRENGLYRMVAA